MKKIALLVVFILLISVFTPVYANEISPKFLGSIKHKVAERICVVPEDGMVITEDTVFCKGTYYLPNGISIGADDITLDGNGAVLKGDGTLIGIDVDIMSNVNIKNCKVNNYDFGIVSKGTNNLIRNNILQNNLLSGIELREASDNILENNEIEDNNMGIVLREGGYNIIRSNTVTDNEGSGISISSGSSNNNVNGNFVYANGRNGVDLGLETYMNYIENNFISQNGHGGIPGWDYQGIRLINTDNNTIRGNTITFNQIGIAFWDISSFGNIIEYNSIFGSSRYDFYNDRKEDINAENNYWGTNNSSEISEKIYDYYENPHMGIVDFDPWLYGQADLAVVDIYFEPENPVVGDEINVTAILTNFGDIGSIYSSGFSVEGPTGFGGASRVDPNNPLEPGEIEEFIFDFEPVAEGTYVITVRINSVLEDSNLTNNVRVEELEVVVS